MNFLHDLAATRDECAGEKVGDLDAGSEIRSENNAFPESGLVSPLCRRIADGSAIVRQPGEIWTDIFLVDGERLCRTVSGDQERRSHLLGVWRDRVTDGSGDPAHQHLHLVAFDE